MLLFASLLIFSASSPIFVDSVGGCSNKRSLHTISATFSFRNLELLYTSTAFAICPNEAVGDISSPVQLPNTPSFRLFEELIQR
ncbi:hypothetical protein SDJN03_13453, partial [Cucurbita argyrosperma subsp. sororia]